MSGMSSCSVTEKTVLVVDDEPGIRRFVRAALVRQGYRVMEAEDGLAAYDLLHRLSGAVDAVVTDVKMPGMDGIALGEKVNAEFPDVTVIYMSGFIAELPKKEIPLRRFLQKPFGAQVLMQRLQAL